MGYRAGLEDAARFCMEEITRRAGYNGQWEGYGPSKGYRTGPEIAALIRAALAQKFITRDTPQSGPADPPSDLPLPSR